MGVGGISIWQLLILLVIVILLFGTRKLPRLGKDLGDAINGFRDSMKRESQGVDEESTNKEPKEKL